MAKKKIIKKKIIKKKQISAEQKIIEAGNLVKLIYPNLWLAVEHHRTHRDKYITFKNHSYLKGIYKDNSHNIAIMKSSQSGVSEFLIVYAINESQQARNVLYALPTAHLMTLFIKGRVDPSIAYTPMYRELHEIAKIELGAKATESTTLKTFGKGNIYFVGTQSDAGFISHPVDTIIIDELDKCNQDVLSLAPSRQSHSELKKNIKVSNPTIMNTGIDVEYKLSDQKVWIIKCEKCNTDIIPDFFQHIVEEVGNSEFIVRDSEYDEIENPTIRPICHKCGAPYNRYALGEWVAQNTNSSVSGYSMNKIFTSTDTIYELVVRFTNALENEIDLQSFYNMDLGQPFTPTGSKIDTDILTDCEGDYLMPDRHAGPCIAGIDVGKIINIVVAHILPDGKDQIVCVREVLTPEEILDIFRLFNVKFFVIDAMPETRMSRSLALTMAGGFMAFFGGQKTQTKINANEKIVTADRTSTLDAVKEGLLTKNIILPKNANKIKNFYEQLTASTRIYNENRDTYTWVETGPDHYFLAMGYMKLAKKIMLAVAGRRK